LLVSSFHLHHQGRKKWWFPMMTTKVSYFILEDSISMWNHVSCLTSLRLQRQNICRDQAKTEQTKGGRIKQITSWNLRILRSFVLHLSRIKRCLWDVFLFCNSRTSRKDWHRLWWEEQHDFYSGSSFQTRWLCNTFFNLFRLSDKKSPVLNLGIMAMMVNAYETLWFSPKSFRSRS
jgi:hypothetical protein